MALFVVVEMEGIRGGALAGKQFFILPGGIRDFFCRDSKRAVLLMYYVPAKKGRTSLGAGISPWGLHGVYLGAGEFDRKERWWGQRQELGVFTQKW